MIDTPEKQSAAAQPDGPAYPNRKIWLIVGGTLTAAVLLFAMAVAGVWIWTASSPKQSTDEASEFPGPVTSAEIDVEIGDIELTPAAGTDVEVDRRTEWRGLEPDVTEQVQGGVFTARAGCDEGSLIMGGFDDCRVDYTVGLPAGVAVDVVNDVGDIRLDGLDGEVEAESSIGDIVGVGLRTGDIRVESSVGEVELEFAQVLGDITVTADTGDVVIEVPDDGTTYAVQSDLGVGEQDVDIATDPDATADRVISVTSGVGNLTVRYAA